MEFDPSRQFQIVRQGAVYALRGREIARRWLLAPAACALRRGSRGAGVDVEVGFRVNGTDDGTNKLTSDVGFLTRNAMKKHDFRISAQRGRVAPRRPGMSLLEAGSRTHGL